MRNKISWVVILYYPERSVIDNIKTYASLMDCVYLWRNSKIDKSVENELNLLLGDNIVWCGGENNVGIGVALNNILSISKSLGTDWLLTMDQDSSFSDGAIDMISNQLSGINTNTDGIAIVAANHVVNGIPAHNNSDSPKWVMMSGNFVNTRLAVECGGFNQDLFIDGVDIEFCRRLIARGYKVTIIYDAYLEHNLGGACQVSFFGYKTITTNHSPVRLYYIYRNYLYMCTRVEWCKEIRRELYRFLIHKLGCVILFETGKLKKINMIIKGGCHFMMGHFGPNNK